MQRGSLGVFVSTPKKTGHKGGEKGCDLTVAPVSNMMDTLTGRSQVFFTVIRTKVRMGSRFYVLALVGGAVGEGLRAAHLLILHPLALRM